MRYISTKVLKYEGHIKELGPTNGEMTARVISTRY